MHSTIKIKRHRANNWTATEDAIVVRHLPRVSIKKLRHRSLQAIKQRRWVLKNGLLDRNSANWTKKEDAIIRRDYPTADRARDLLPLLPGRNLIDIKDRASSLGVWRLFAGNDDVRFKGSKELIDQIRVRAKRDGISFRYLDEVTGRGRYFQINGQKSRSLHLRRIVKALDFFGGKLTIDWCDR